MLPLTKISKIVIHHSQSDNHTPESIKQLHVLKNKWIDIGYHWLIDKKGELHQGRSEKFQGAHVLGHNQNSIGICLIGNLDEHPPISRTNSNTNKLFKDKNKTIFLRKIFLVTKNS